MNNRHKILIYGYGNPGLQDDGAGNELVSRLEKWVTGHHLYDIEFDSNYQLNIEDAYAMTGKDIVVFIDATVNESIEDMSVTRVEPSSKVEFTMHSVSPSFVLDLCQKIYNEHPATYLVHIRGFGWEFLEEMTPGVVKNLDKALDFFKKALAISDISGIKEFFDKYAKQLN